MGEPFGNVSGETWGTDGEEEARGGHVSGETWGTDGEDEARGGHTSGEAWSTTETRGSERDIPGGTWGGSGGMAGAPRSMSSRAEASEADIGRKRGG